MTLQTAFYILGIVFMSLMLILLVALVAAVFVIRAKVVAIHRQIDEKISELTQLANSGGKIVSTVGSKIAKAWSKKRSQK